MSDSVPAQKPRTVIEMLNSVGIEQELLLTESAKRHARRARKSRVEYVDPVQTLRALYPTTYSFSTAMGCGILRANGRVLSIRCTDESKKSEIEITLARSLLECVGIDLLHQHTLRDQVVCTFPLRKRARGAVPFVWDITPNRLISMVATTHECARDKIHMVLRRHPTEPALIAYATELPNKTIEPRAFFASSRDAVRDALVHSMEPLPSFVIRFVAGPAPPQPQETD